MDIVNKSIYPIQKLSNVTILQRGKFSHRPRNDERFYNGEYPFIQTGDVVKANQKHGKIEYSQTLNELGLSVSKLFQPDVLVFTIAANIGDTAILDYPACFPDSLITIVPKTSELNLYYLNIYLKFLKPYLENLAPQAAQKNINLQQLSPTPVVVPPMAVQNQIVEKFESAYQSKREKEAEAERLLATVDDLVLDALGITLPAQEENTLDKRIFFTKSSEISNGRFDAFYHTNYYKVTEKLIANSKVNFLPLKKVTTKITDGSHYSPASSKEFAKKYVTVRDINSYGEINFKNCYSVSEEDFELLEKSGCRPEIGDVLFSKDGTIGKTHTVSNTNDFVILSSLAILRPNTNLINPKYLEYILKTELILSLIKRLMGGSALQRIILQNLKELLIPIPPPEEQKEIAEKVEAIYAEAKRLREEGKETLKQAKLEVEKMILGTT